MENNELGIYIHIPFCKSKCYYCDFVSYSNKCENIEKYVESIITEVNSYNLDSYNVTTIYIGGGTPSYINSKFIITILQKLKDKLKNNKTSFDKIEITIEVNPGTINESKLEDYKYAGINRISIGLQSTNNNILKQIGRIHTFEDFMVAYDLIKKLKFENVNIDLMIGLPNQTIQDINKSVEEVIKLNPSHISVYSLILEEDTKLNDLINNRQMKLPDEALERQMYKYVKNKLELNGYIHYEISNFSKKGKESKHNVNCWEQKQYIGIGLAAHSYLESKRYSNIENIKTYMNNINNKELDKNRVIHEVQSIEDKQKEYMLLGLRKIEGVSILRFKEKFVQNPIYIFRKQLAMLIDKNLVEINGNYIKLTTRGLDFANIVWEEFI